MHRLHVGASCGLWGLWVWAFTLRTSSVCITWELVNAIIHLASPYSELLGWTQQSVSSHICPPGDSDAPSGLETVGRETSLMLFWVKEGNICRVQELGSPEESGDYKMQTIEIQEWRPKVLSIPLWPQVFNSGRP